MITHTSDPASSSLFQRVRHELKARVLTVSDASYLTPNMRRLVLTGDDLADFDSAGFDDHVKVILTDASGNREMRDYTPRRFDRESRMLTIDFAMHDAGPITNWARNAHHGDQVTIGGPRGSSVVVPEVRRFLLIGDETALPAIGRKLEEAREDDEIHAIIAVGSAAEEQRFDTRARAQVTYIYRPLSSADDPTPLLPHVESLEIRPETLVWAGAEAKVARAIRQCMTDVHGIPLGWIKASGYWVSGQADASEKA